MIKGKAALIVIDVQAGLLDKDSVFFDQKNVEIIERTRTLVDKCREEHIPIVFVREVHRPSGIDFGRELDGSEGVHALENSPRVLVPEEVGVLPEDPQIPKRRYSAFLYTDLQVVLNGLGVFPGDTLILCGFLTDVCVHYTFVDAHQMDYRLRVVKDCCGASEPDFHEGALQAMGYLQSEAPVDLKNVLAEIDAYGKMSN